MSLADDLIEISMGSFQKRCGMSPSATVLAPGRINLIGDHTDYTGGLAMPCPINRFICICISPLPGPHSKIYTSHDPESIWEPNFSRGPNPEKDWQKFVWGAVKVLGLQRKSFAMTIHSNLPAGLGISSSAALGTGLLKAIAHVFGLKVTKMEICHLAQQIENDFLGVQTGLLDQMAVVFGKREALLVIDFQDNSMVHIPFASKGLTWVLVNSRVERKLAASGYSRRVQECQQALLQLQQRFKRVLHYRDVTPEHLDWLAEQAEYISHKRMLHFVGENQRVRGFAEALRSHDLPLAGKLMCQSHDSLRDNYESSHPMVDELQAYMVASPSCLGARIMGGGFGGSVIGLLEAKPESRKVFRDHLAQSGRPQWQAAPFEATNGLILAKEEVE